MSALVAACAISLEPRLISIPDSRGRPATHIDTILSYEDAVATIALLFERELGFARFPVTFHLYPGRGAFEAALLATGYDPALARSTANTMSAIGGYRRVLLNDNDLATVPWPNRVGLLAHEMTHSLQYELGGGRRGASFQWLREGFGDWVALRILERLDAASLREIRRARLDEVRNNRSRLPRLADIVTFPQWVAYTSREQMLGYAYAFLAVDLLIERHGVAAVLRYFEMFAQSEDRDANFIAAFGEDLAAFEAALAEQLG